jgi:hypothetical protein
VVAQQQIKPKAASSLRMRSAPVVPAAHKKIAPRRCCDLKLT